MSIHLSRRAILKTAGAAALLMPAGSRALSASTGPPPEGSDTPKICLEVGAGRLSAGGADENGMRRVKQLGVDHVLMGGPPIPWQESQIRSTMESFKSGG